jgi:hypothetical protein
MLVHMTPGEVAGLQALAMKHGGSLTINPETGLAEAGFLKKLLPAVIGFGLNMFAPGLGSAVGAALGTSAAVGTGIAVGGFEALRTGSLSKGLSAGLGAYGGANLAGSMAGAGTMSLADQAAQASGLGVEKAALAQGLSPETVAAMKAQAIEEAGNQAVFSNADKLSAGFNAVTKDPSTFGQFAKQNAGALLAATSPVIADQGVETVTKMNGPAYIQNFDYDPMTQRAKALNPVSLKSLGYPGYADGGLLQMHRKFAEGGAADNRYGSSQAAYNYLMGLTDTTRPDVAPLPIEQPTFYIPPATTTSMTTTPVTGGGGGGGIGGGGGGGGGASVGNAGSDTDPSSTYSGFQPAPPNPDIPVVDIIPTPVTSPDDDFPSTYPEPVVEPYDFGEPEPAPNPVYDYGEPEPEPAPNPVYDYGEPTSEPNPVYDYTEPTSEPNPVYDYTEPTSEPTSEPNPVYDYGEPEPAPAPVYDYGEPEPTPFEPAPVYDYGEPTPFEPEPVYDYREPEPTPFEPAPVYDYREPEPPPAPVYDYVEPSAPVYDYVEPPVEPYYSDTTEAVQDFQNVDNSGYYEGSMAGDNSLNSDRNTYTGTASESPEGLPDAFGSYPSEPTYIGNFDGGGYDGFIGDEDNIDEDSYDYQGMATGGMVPGYADGGVSGSGSLDLHVPINIGGGGGGGGGFGGGYTPVGGGNGMTSTPNVNPNANGGFGGGLAGMFGGGGRPQNGFGGMPQGLAGLFGNSGFAPQGFMGQMQRMDDMDMYSHGPREFMEVPDAQNYQDIIRGRSNMLVGMGGTAQNGYKSPGGMDGYNPFTGRPFENNIAASFHSIQSTPSFGGTFAQGGSVGSHLGGYSDGGRLLRGPGDGVSDSIPASIGKHRQPARLADGEFVVPARIVSELGNGSTEAGARKLYAMMDRIQAARRKTVGKGRVAKNSRAEKHLPA